MINNLKTLKVVDITGQAAVGLLPMLYATLTHGQPAGGIFFTLFGLGGWQLVSFGATLLVGPASWKSPLRTLYTVLLCLLALIGLAALVNEEALALLAYSALFGGPVLGLLYFILSLAEWRNLKMMTNINTV